MDTEIREPQTRTPVEVSVPPGTILDSYGNYVLMIVDTHGLQQQLHECEKYGHTLSVVLESKSKHNQWKVGGLITTDSICLNSKILRQVEPLKLERECC